MQNSITSPRQFFELIVTPNFHAFYESQGDLRLAFNACVSLNQLADWIAAALKENPGQFLEKKYKEKAEIRTVRHLANNFKHFEVREPTPQLTVETSAASLTFDDWASVDDVANVDLHGIGPQSIARSDDGTKINFVEAISATYLFWKNEYVDEKKWRE